MAKQISRSRFFSALFVVSLAFVALAASRPALAEKDRGDSSSSGPSAFLGPSFHLSLGIRMKKAPDLDTYYSTVGGVKISLFGIQAGNQAYISFAAPGLQYAGYGIFAPSFSPVIVNHNFGLGFAFDFFPTRQDRMGGPVGMSMNLDIVRLFSALASLAR